MTTWKRIPGFSRYVVSDVGTVAAKVDDFGQPSRILSVRTNHGGYVEVKLLADYIEGVGTRRVWRKVHNLVLEAFIGPRPSPRHHGAHAPDRSKTNNRVANLRWATPEENEADKAAHGTKTGAVGAPPIPARRRAAILRRLANGESATSIARIFGLHRSSVTRLAKREANG